MKDSTETPGAAPVRRGATGLTERQRTILDVIRASVTGRGYPPSIREIGDAFDIKSTNGVNDHLTALERKGYLKRGPRQSSRTLTLVAQEPE